MIEDHVIHYNDLTPQLARKGCFVLAMPNEAYHAYEGISKSGLDLVNRSPAHYAFRAPRKPTRAMEMGTAIHTAILEPERFHAEYMLLRDVHARTASEYKQAVKRHGSERTLVSTEADKVAGMQEAVYANSKASDLLRSPGWNEISAFVEDPETGVLLRCRFDKLTIDGIGLDLKKTQDARPTEFSKSAARYRYHVQAAMYSHVFEMIAGEPLARFSIIAVEEESPHACVLFDTFDHDALTIGHREYRADLSAFVEAEKTQHWSCYEQVEQILTLPNWAMADLENDLLEELE